jgi:MarR family transcriptional regulator, organic hydroperoxide resistance regulator
MIVNERTKKGKLSSGRKHLRRTKPEVPEPDADDAAAGTDLSYEKARDTLRTMKHILLQFRVRMDDQLRPQGVTTAQMQVLFAVRNAPGSSGAQLARACYITPQTAQTLLKHLEAAGFIVRGKDPVNDRIVTASITPQGERLAQVVEKRALEVHKVLWKGISEPELARLSSMLDRCLSNLDGEGEDLPACR